MPDLIVTPTVQSLTIGDAASISVGAITYAPEPAVRAFQYSDLNGDCSPFSISTGTSGQPGTATYSYTNNSIDSVFGFIGMVCPAAQGSRIGLFASACTTSTVDRAYTVGYGAWDWSARVSYPNGEQTMRVIAGMGASHGPPDSTSGQKLMLSNGAAFVAYGASGNWIATIADDNNLTEHDTGIPVSEWHTLRITIDAAFTQVLFYVDGSLAYTATSGFWDTQNLLAWGVELRDKKTGGSSGPATINVDYMSLSYTIAR